MEVVARAAGVAARAGGFWSAAATRAPPVKKKLIVAPLDSFWRSVWHEIEMSQKVQYKHEAIEKWLQHAACINGPSRLYRQRASIARRRASKSALSVVRNYSSAASKRNPWHAVMINTAAAAY